jgi:hypothetical protein
MSDYIIPLVDSPNQILYVALGGQQCRIELSQSDYGLFINLYVNDSLIVGGVQCHNLNKIVRDGYLGFIGDLAFHDTQGASDPASPGLGTRYILYYVVPA